MSSWSKYFPACVTSLYVYRNEVQLKFYFKFDIEAKVSFGHSLSIKALGKVGQVLKIYSDGDVRVAVAGHHWTFNPAVLVNESTAAVSTGQQPGQLATPQGGQAHTHSELQGILQPSPSSTSSSASQRQHRRHSTAEEQQNTQQPQREIGIEPQSHHLQK